jgi:acyl-CoA synthetase (AMP-forming)/AMP-acid ligase II
MAKFKIPKKIIFGVIEKTPTGKTQKFLLRKKTNQE